MHNKLSLPLFQITQYTEYEGKKEGKKDYQFP